MKRVAPIALPKPLLTIAVLLGVVPLSFGLGEVDFENFSNSLIYTNSVHNGPATGLMSGTPGVVNPFQAGSYVFGLLTAPTNQTTVDATLSGWSLVGSYGVNTATPGLMYGNEDRNGPGTWDKFLFSGDAANFVVVGWSSNVGWSVSNPSENWGNALAWWNNGNPQSRGWFGISDIAQDVVVGGGPYPIPTIFGPTPGYEVQGFTLNLYDVPEPSAYILVSLGVVSLFGLRRRKSAKALLAIATIWLTWSTGVFAGGGGEVDFENFSNTLIYTNSVHNGPATGLITGDHAYCFMLLAAETNTVDETHLFDSVALNIPLSAGGWVALTQGLLVGTNTPTPGLMYGNNFPSDPGCSIGWPPSGESGNFAVVGWSANLGSDWLNQVLPWWNNGNPTNGVAGWFGISDIAQDVVVGGGPYPIPTIFGPTVGYQVQGFTLNYYEVPEPSSFLLAGLGAAFLLIFRRRS